MQRHGSGCESWLGRAGGVALVTVAPAVACNPPEPELELRTVHIHAAQGCPISTDAQIDLEALGDFSATLRTGESMPIDGRGVGIGIPFDTQAIAASSSTGNQSWWGLGTLDGSDLEVLMLERARACELSAASLAAGYPSGTAGTAMGQPNSHELILAGALVESPDAARAVRIDLDTGRVTEISGGMVPARGLATAGPLGSVFVVAGGVDPREAGGQGFDQLRPLDSASVYDPVLERFDPARSIDISPRARHAAVSLTDGGLLLIGGSGTQSPALASLELLSPTELTARIVGLTQLAFRRRSPQALRLSDGRVFVGGGLDASLQPVGSVEWLSADGSEHLGTTRLETSEPRFAALPGGGVLAVGACRPDTQCPDPARGVVWLDRQGRATQLEALTEAPVDAQLLTAPRGAPLLISGAAGARQLRRFSPWEERFVTPDEVPSELPQKSATLSLEGGALIWITESAGASRILAHRFDLRSPLSRDVGPQLLARPGFLSPVVPDQAPRAGQVENTDRGIELRNGAGVVVSDTSYANLELHLDWQAGPAPWVELGALRIGAAQCPWPSSTPGPIMISRIGAEVTLTVGDASGRCALDPTERVAVSVRGPESEPSVIRSLELVR